MPRKRHKPEEIVAKPRQVHVITAQGVSVTETVPSTGGSEVIDHRWRTEFGGLKLDHRP